MALAVLVLFALVAVPASATEVSELEIRSSVQDATAANIATFTITADDFAAFWYDIDDGVSSEVLYYDNGAGASNPNGPLGLAAGGSNVIDEDELYYLSAPQQVDSEIGLAFADANGNDKIDPGETFVPEDADIATYYKIGLFGDEYVALDGDPSELAKLIIEFDSSDKKTLQTGEEWELGEGLSLVPMQIDLDGEKVWLQLKKNGVEIDSEVIDASSSATDLQRTYVYEDDDDRAIFYCYVDAVFRGTESNIVQLKYVFLRSDDVMELDTGDDYGVFEIKSFSYTVP
ncbi:hypothetical protein DRN72_02215, partial [Methanosarcinales archaeon]